MGQHPAGQRAEHKRKHFCALIIPDGAEDIKGVQMKNKLNGAAFCSVLALGLLSDGLMDKLGPVGYAAVGGIAIVAAMAAMFVAELGTSNRRTSYDGKQRTGGGVA